MLLRFVELRVGHNSSANSPTGIYSCDIPTNDVHNDDDISVRDMTVEVCLAYAGPIDRKTLKEEC